MIFLANSNSKEIELPKDPTFDEMERYSREVYQQGRVDAIEQIEEFVRECKINQAMDKPCDECKYSHHNYRQTCLEYVLQQLKGQKNE